MNKHKEERDRRFVVCPRCGGHGTHVNPSIDGFTSADLDEWYGGGQEREEFLDAYFTRGGVYDVRCEECGGQRVVREDCDCAECDRAARELADLLAMERAERAFGC